MLEHVEYPDKVELAISKWKALGSGQLELNPFRVRRRRQRKGGPAEIAADHVEVGPRPLHSLGDGARPAPDVQHPAVNRLEVRKQIAQLQPIHEPRPGRQTGSAPALRLVVERRGGRYRLADFAA